MLSILRRCNYIAKSSTPLLSSTLKNRSFGPLVQCREMSSKSVDEELNKPARNLDYCQLLEKKKSNNAVLIDVREHTEINETGKLPDSIHIPLGELSKALSDMTVEEFEKKYNAARPGKDVLVIFSCKAGGRSRRALAQAYELGYANAAHYKGGWLDWAEKSKQ